MMNILKRAYERFTGVLAHDYQGKPLRKGDIVYARHPGEVFPEFQFGMEVMQKTPKYCRVNGDVQVVSPCGSIKQAFGIQLKKQPPLSNEANWSQMEDITGWSPKELPASQPSTTE